MTKRICILSWSGFRRRIAIDWIQQTSCSTPDGEHWAAPPPRVAACKTVGSREPQLACDRPHTVVVILVQQAACMAWTIILSRNSFNSIKSALRLVTYYINSFTISCAVESCPYQRLNHCSTHLKNDSRLPNAARLVQRTRLVFGHCSGAQSNR
jgi:hypothetical protein